MDPMVMNALPYFMEACILSSAASMAVGWWLIRRKRIEAHRRFMLLGASLALLFFVSYAAKTVFIGDTSFGGPSQLRLPYQTFLQIHSFLATVAGIMGIVVLRLAWKQKFSQHKKIAPWTVSLWFVTTITGLAVFLLLYVLYPPGPTTNAFKAWLGR
jgi:putative membrane protein